MNVARSGTGGRAIARAYLSQVHPVFMLPPVAASLFGAVLAGRVDPAPAATHAVAIFAAVYTAHVKDGYVDFYVRGEDDDHPLTATGCRIGLILSTATFALACLALLVLVDSTAVALTAPAWAIGYLHAPQLDTNPVTATAGYPVGIGLAVVGGYYAQAGTVGVIALGFATVLVLLLSGIKVIDDATDHAFDRSIEKRTVAVAVGLERTYPVAYALMAAGLLGVVGLTAAGVFPPASAIAAVAFGAVAVAASRAPPGLATMLLVRGSYVFLAVLVAAVWFEPLAALA